MTAIEERAACMGRQMERKSRSGTPISGSV
jgi:hypothetical protein